MATINAVSGTGKVTVSGSGYSGAKTFVSVTYTAADNKRRYVECYQVNLAAGALSYDAPAPFTAGTVVAKTLDGVSSTALATSSNVSV